MDNSIIPKHYNRFSITPFQVIDSWKLDFYLGNVVKYICRRNDKGTALQDLKKAQEYLNQAIKRLENNDGTDNFGQDKTNIY